MSQPLSLFSAFGIELEYMLVDAASLDVRPIADRVMQLEAGSLVSDVEFDDISWSNELVLHVLELKTSTPRRRWLRLPGRYRHMCGE